MRTVQRLRELQPYELELVVGGLITLYGYRTSSGISWFQQEGSDPNEAFAPVTDGGTGGEWPDEEQIVITVTFEPTEEQKKFIEAYKQAIERADAVIKALPDDKKIKLSDGSTVTGKELKALWAKTDFVINPDTHPPYANGSDRGEANYNGGDPIVSQNMKVLVGYGAHGAAGFNFLVLHEVGHLTAANRLFDLNDANPQDAVERMASDIGRAIAYTMQLDFLPATGVTAPTWGYSTENPLVFE